MDLSPYIDNLRRELAAVADAGGDEARAIAERLTAPLESAARLALLDVLSAAAAEITRDLAPGSVDLRLRGREPGFVVTVPPADRWSDQPEDRSLHVPVRASPEAEEGTMTRINLRLPEDLKTRVEDAARQAGVSVNTWLVRSAATSLQADDRAGRPDRRTERRAATGGERFAGWVR